MRNRVYIGAIEQMSREPAIRQLLRPTALVVLSYAQASAPRRTGDYMSGLKMTANKVGPARVVIAAYDSKSVMLEYGTGVPAPSPHFEVLTRAVRKAKFKRVEWVPHVRKGRRA